MKMAVFSDVHANLAAFQAVLKDIRKRNVDYLVCAGDLVGDGPFPNEVVQFVQEQNIPCIIGDYDDAVGFSRIEYVGCDTNENTIIRREQSIKWTKKHTSEENKEYLRLLPHEIRIETEGKRILVVHGSPKQLNEYLREDISLDYLKELLEEEGIDILICGHTHIPYHRVLDKGHIVNVGSIGKSEQGNLSAIYALIHIENNILVEFIDVPYNFEATAQAIETSELPHEFADMLRKGSSF